MFVEALHLCYTHTPGSLSDIGTQLLDNTAPCAVTNWLMSAGQVAHGLTKLWHKILDAPQQTQERIGLSKLLQAHNLPAHRTKQGSS